jgi:hypothetical protein
MGNQKMHLINKPIKDLEDYQIAAISYFLKEQDLNSAVCLLYCLELPYEHLFDNNFNQEILIKSFILMIQEQWFKQYVKDKGLLMSTDTEQIKIWAKEVISKNDKVVQDIKKGNNKAIGRLVGEVKKLAGTSANFDMINKILIELIKE